MTLVFYLGCLKYCKAHSNLKVNWIALNYNAMIPKLNACLWNSYCAEVDVCIHGDWDKSFV